MRENLLVGKTAKTSINVEHLIGFFNYKSLALRIPNHLVAKSEQCGNVVYLRVPAPYDKQIGARCIRTSFTRDHLSCDLPRDEELGLAIQEWVRYIEFPERLRYKPLHVGRAGYVNFACKLSKRW